MWSFLWGGHTPDLVHSLHNGPLQEFLDVSDELSLLWGNPSTSGHQKSPGQCLGGSAGIWPWGRWTGDGC